MNSELLASIDADSIREAVEAMGLKLVRMATRADGLLVDLERVPRTDDDPEGGYFSVVIEGHGAPGDRRLEVSVTTRTNFNGADGPAIERALDWAARLEATLP